jgi:hypothetical protein
MLDFLKLRVLGRNSPDRQLQAGSGAPFRAGWTLAIWLLTVAASGCQDPGQPGVMERAGAQIDQTMGRAQQDVGDFSLRVGRALSQAGQSVGDAANVAGTRVHDWLVPADQADQATTVGPRRNATYGQ